VNKPTLKQLCTKHLIGVLQLAQESQVDTLLAGAMLAGQEVRVIDAQKVIVGLNRLCHTRYTLNDVDMKLK
jgi:hypothetical protein